MIDACCSAAGGGFWGAGTTCDPNAPVKACCMPEGGCSDLTQCACETQYGDFKQNFTCQELYDRWGWRACPPMYGPQP